MTLRLQYIQRSQSQSQVDSCCTLSSRFQSHEKSHSHSLANPDRAHSPMDGSAGSHSYGSLGQWENHEMIRLGAS